MDHPCAEPFRHPSPLPCLSLSPLRPPRTTPEAASRRMAPRREHPSQKQESNGFCPLAWANCHANGRMDGSGLSNQNHLSCFFDPTIQQSTSLPKLSLGPSPVLKSS
ncbi:hypothetical protein CGRA01v4_07611 [Colletotrichum graminicola]|nr:hypothetical protein CGRA01v4_07611 [Colletotrichum graminicola]